MPKTYEPIATTRLTSSAATYTFTSIPSTYTDLVLVHNGSVSTAGSYYIRVNSDTGNNYSTTLIYGDGSSGGSLRDSNTNIAWSGYNDTGQATNISNFMNYSNTSVYKTILHRSSQGTSSSARVSLWRSTAAINSIYIATQFGTFNPGSTFTLYGIKAA